METTPDETRELLKKVESGDATDDDLAELQRFVKARRLAKESRLAAIQEIQLKMSQNSLTLSDLFTTEEIRAATPRKVAGTSRQARPKTNTSEQYLVIEVKPLGGRGPSSRFYHGQVLPKIVSKGFKSLDDGNLEVNLAKHYTEGGKRYFATPQGVASLARLVAFIKSSPATKV